MEQIIEGNWIKSPVAIQSHVIKPVNDLHLLLEILHVNRTHCHLVPFLDPIDDPVHPLWRFPLQRNVPGIKGADTLQPRSLGKLCVVRGIPRHGDKRGPVIPLRHDPAVIIDRGIIGSTHGGQSLAQENTGRSIDKGLSNRRIIHEIKESEKADRVLVVAVVGAIDDGSDAPNRFAIANRNQGMNLSMLVGENRL